MRLGPFPFCLYKDKQFIFRILIFSKKSFNYFSWCISAIAAPIVLSASPNRCFMLLATINTCIAISNACASWISSLLLVMSLFYVLKGRHFCRPVGLILRDMIILQTLLRRLHLSPPPILLAQMLLLRLHLLRQQTPLSRL